MAGGRTDDLGGYHEGSDDTAPAGLSSGALHSKEQEDDVRAKAASGQMIGQDSLDYLGHFANDNVTKQGHNVGHKPKGVAHFKGGAKRGFHKIAGTATGMIGAGFPFERRSAAEGYPAAGRDSARARDRRPSGVKLPEPKPPMAIPSVTSPVPVARGISDLKLSAKHHRESIANDQKHMREHKESIAKHKSLLKTRTKQLRGKA